MKNVAATNGQSVSLASFFLEEEKACAGNLVVTGILLNFCGVLFGRPPLSYGRFGSKLATAGYRVHRAVQEKSERAPKSFSQSCVPDPAGRGVYCGANQNTRRRKRNAPIYSAESDRSCRCVVHGGRRTGAARKLCSRHGDGWARAEGHGLHRSPCRSGRGDKHSGCRDSRREGGAGAGAGLRLTRDGICLDHRGGETDSITRPGEGCRHGRHPAPGQYSIFFAEGPAREPGGRQEHEPVLSRKTRRHTDRTRIVVDYETSGGALRLLD